MATTNGLVLPPAVAPVQVVILPIAQHKEGVLDRARALKAELEKAGLRVELDDRDTYSAGWKFNEWEMKGVPCRIEIGPRDLENGVATLVRRDTGEKTTAPLDTLTQTVPELLDKIHQGMYDKAAAFMQSHIREVSSLEELGDAVSHSCFALADWCGDPAPARTASRKRSRPRRAICRSTSRGSAKNACAAAERQNTRSISAKRTDLLFFPLERKVSKRKAGKRTNFSLPLFYTWYAFRIISDASHV